MVGTLWCHASVCVIGLRRFAAPGKSLKFGPWLHYLDSPSGESGIRSMDSRLQRLFLAAIPAGGYHIFATGGSADKGSSSHLQRYKQKLSGIVHTGTLYIPRIGIYIDRLVLTQRPISLRASSILAYELCTRRTRPP